MTSRPIVKSLQKQVTELENKIKEMSWNTSAEDEVKRFHHDRNVVYVHKDRKVSKFSGYNIPVEDWIEDVTIVMYSRDMTRQERADLIYSNLEGSAKDELKYRSHIVRQSPEQILEILQDAFGVKDNITKLQKNFLDRAQKPNETLREYSYVLMDLMSKITKRDSAWIPNREKTLSDQFSQNVRDTMLRKHLKQIVRIRPDIPFLDLREEAIMWSEEEEFTDKTDKVQVSVREKPLSDLCTGTTKTDSNEKSSKINELMDIVKKQSEQIETLTKIVNSKQRLPHNYNYNSQQSKQQRAFLCFGCNKPGHKVADCPNKENQGK